MVLLGIAWAISYRRREVSLRPVVWGVGLQFLLALIILRRDVWSFLGMALLALLAVAYLWSGGGDEPRSWRRPATAAAAGLASGAGLLLLPSPAPAAAFLASALLLAANLRLRRAFLGRFAGAALVVCGTAWLISRGHHGRDVFEAAGAGIADFLSLARYGAAFLFGNLADPAYFFPGPDAGWPGFGFLFAFYLLPVIIFFAGFMSVLYYLGIMQRVIESFSHFLRWTIGTSGVETLNASANIFIGQTEAPLLVRPYLAGTTRSELFAIMAGGFATIAGGAFAAYIAMGVPAVHLLAASVMSAPAALAIAKVIHPETERSQTAGDVDLPAVEVGSNLIEAASNGITDGLKLALNVAAMLIGFITLIAVADVALNFLDSLIDGRLLGGEEVAYSAGGMSPVTGEFRGVFPGSLQTLFGTLLRPLAWLIGVPWAEAASVGHLLGVMISLNEFVAYSLLGHHIQAGALSERAIALATYALCGFANFASIGIQIGGLGALVPERRADLAELGMKAMIAGALASWLTAAIAGILLPG